LISLALLGALALAGCATFQADVAKFKAAYDTIASSTVSPAAVQVARSTFNSLEILATKYQRLPRCTGANGPVCRDPALRTRIDAAIVAGRGARAGLVSFMKSHPDALGAQGLYDALNASIDEIKTLTAAFRAAVGP
jgi:hypothetical protein